MKISAGKLSYDRSLAYRDSLASYPAAHQTLYLSFLVCFEVSTHTCAISPRCLIHASGTHPGGTQEGYTSAWNPHDGAERDFRSAYQSMEQGLG